MSHEKEHRQKALDNIAHPVRRWCGDANSQEPSLDYLNGLWHESFMMHRRGALFTLNALSLSPLLMPKRALEVSVAHAHSGQADLVKQFTNLHLARVELLRRAPQEHIIVMRSLRYVRAVIAERKADPAIMVDVFEHLSELSTRAGINVRFIRGVPVSTTPADMRFMQYDRDGRRVMAASIREPVNEATLGVGAARVDDLWKEYEHVRTAADPGHASANTFQAMGIFALTES